MSIKWVRSQLQQTGWGSRTDIAPRRPSAASEEASRTKVKGGVVGLGNTVGMAIGVLVEEMAS